MDRLISFRKAEFAENSDFRIRQARAQPNVPLPPISGMIRPDWREQLCLERGPEEEIVLEAPVTTAEPIIDADIPLVPHLLHEVTEEDRARFNPSSAMLDLEDEKIQTAIGLSMVNELEDEIGDDEAVAT